MKTLIESLVIRSCAYRHYFRTNHGFSEEYRAYQLDKEASHQMFLESIKTYYAQNRLPETAGEFFITN
jgi:hypothetical protein